MDDEDQAKVKIKVLQASLESAVNELKKKTEEAAARSKELAEQKDLVGQIDKKLNALAKENKLLVQANDRFKRARDEMVSCEVQTDADALLVAAEAARDTAVAALAEEKKRSASALEAAQARVQTLQLDNVTDITPKVVDKSS